MTFGEGREGGGFTISPSAVVNTLGALALAGITSVVLSDHSDLRVAQDENRRFEIEFTTIENNLANTSAAVQSLRDECDAQKTAITNLRETVKDDQKKLSELDLILRPPPHANAR